MGFLSDIAHAVNHLTHQAGPRFIINHKIARYGVMTQLNIDPVQKTIDAQLQLKGETQPLHIRIDNYALDTTSPTPTFTAGQITISREWMQLLATDLVQGKPQPLPPAIAKWLPLLL